MLESNRVNFWYLSPTWTRSPIGVGITLRCNLGSPGFSRHPTLCRNINRGRNPSRSRSPSSTRGHTDTRSP